MRTTRFLTTKILSVQVFGIDYSTIEDAIHNSPASGGVGQSTHGGSSSSGNDWKRSVKKISTSSTLRAAAAVSSRGGNSSSSTITASHQHSHSHPSQIQSHQSSGTSGNAGGQFQTQSTGLKPKRPIVASGSDSSTFGESLTTQTLTAMLRNPAMPVIPSGPSSRDGGRRTGGGIDGLEVARRRMPGGGNVRGSMSRPTSLYVTSGEVGKGRGSRGSKNYRRKTGAVAANLYSSRSETCIYTASNEDSFTKTIDKGTKASAESDGQKQKSQKASKRGLLRGSTSRLDSGSVIATDDDFDSDNTGNNAFELSYDTDTFHNDLLTKQLIINVEDATPCAGGPHSTQSHVADDEMSISSHDTQMSWLQATADGLSRQPKLRTGVNDMSASIRGDTGHDAEKSKERHFSSPSRSRGDSNSSHSTCYSASGAALPIVQRRQKTAGDGCGNVNRPRPQSVVETTFTSSGRAGDASGGNNVVEFSQSATASQMASAKTAVGLRNSWCVGYAPLPMPRRSDSSSGLVRFAEDVSLSEQVTTDHGMSDQEEEEDSAVFQQDATLSPRDASLISDAPESLLSHGDQESETPIGLQSGREDLTRLSVSSSENGDELDESGGGHDGNRQSQNIMGSGYGLDSSWSTENRSLIMGGNLTGWTREAAFMLWRRVLGIIGDVNEICHEETKAVVFSHLLDLHDILQNIANHQKFVDDETGQFCLPAHVPPVPILLPWAIGACRINVTNPNPNSVDIQHSTKISATSGHQSQILSSSLLQQSQIRVGTSTLLAHKLAARTVLKYPALDTGIISSFYQIVYENLKLGNAYLDELFVKELYTVYGCRLPGSMVLLKVLVDNATTVMDRFYNQTSVANSSSVDTECVEKAVLFLGSLVSFPGQHSNWTCLTGRLRGKTETTVYPMTQLAQSISTALTNSARNPAMCLQAACRSLSTLCIAAICSIFNSASSHSSKDTKGLSGTVVTKENSEPSPSYRYEESLYELFCHLKFERIQEATNSGINTGGNTKRFLTTCEFSMAQLSTCHILTIFDALLAADVDASTLHEVITSLIASVVNLVKNFLPDQKMLNVVVSLLCTINDCVSKLPLDILTYSEDKVDQRPDGGVPEGVDSIHNLKHSTDDKDLPQAVHKGLAMVLAQCRKWLNHMTPLDSESMNGSENSLEPGPADSLVPHLPNARTGSSSSSSNVSASLKIAETEGGASHLAAAGVTPSVSGMLPTMGSTRATVSHGTSPVAKDQIEIVEQIQQTTDLVSNIILGLIGQYPSVEGGVTKLDSCITEAHDNPAAGTGATDRNGQGAGKTGGLDAMHFSLIDNDYTQTFVYNDNTVITVLELPRERQQVGSEDEEDVRIDSLDSDTDSRRVVRFIIRDLSGKYCFDFIPTDDDENEEHDLNTSAETHDEDVRPGLDTTLPGGDVNVIRRPDVLEGYSHTVLIESSDSSDNAQVYGSSPESSHMPMSILRTSNTITTTSEGSQTMTRDDTIGGGSTFPSLSTDVIVDMDGEEGERTEHGDTTQSTTLKFDILDYLDSPVWDANRVPNALNEVLGFLSTSEDLLDYQGQRLDAPRGLQGLMERRFREEIEGMQETMLEKERREMELGRRQPMTMNGDANSATLLGGDHTGISPEMDHNRHQLRGEERRPFETSARLLMQLNCFSWANRKLLHLLNKCPSLMKELKHLDSQSLRDAHKIAVVYVGSGQETKSAILSNSAGSNHYEAFLHALGWEVDVETHKGYLGMLRPTGTSGKTMLYFASPTYEIAYHVVTRMLGTDDQKWRHVGNDHVHVVWNEHCRPYVRSVMPTQFADVLIVLTPLQQSQPLSQQHQQLQQPMMLVNISCKHPIESHLLGPLFDGAIVEACVLPQLVRATAVRASQLVKQSKNSPIFYSSRQQTIQSIVKRFKLHQTFEDFVAEAVNPHSRGSGTGGPGTGHNTSLSASSLTQSNRSSVNVGSVSAGGVGGGTGVNNTGTLVASDSWESAMHYHHHHHQPQQSYHAPQSSRETSMRSGLSGGLESLASTSLFDLLKPKQQSANQNCRSQKVHASNNSNQHHQCNSRQQQRHQQHSSKIATSLLASTLPCTFVNYYAKYKHEIPSPAYTSIDKSSSGPRNKIWRTRQGNSKLRDQVAKSSDPAIMTPKRMAKTHLGVASSSGAILDLHEGTEKRQQGLSPGSPESGSQMQTVHKLINGNTVSNSREVKNHRKLSSSVSMGSLIASSGHTERLQMNNGMDFKKHISMSNVCDAEMVQSSIDIDTLNNSSVSLSSLLDDSSSIYPCCNTVQLFENESHVSF